MSFFENGIKAKVMSTQLLIEADVSKKILFECVKLAQDFEEKYSAYKEESLLCKINKNAGIQAIKCSTEELEIFKIALEIAESSSGVFDPTIGILTQGTYGFGKESPRVPSDTALKKVQELVNYKKVSLKSDEIYLMQKGMQFDLGGIGKGYVADKIIQQLRIKKASKALVNVGGEICSYGKKYNIALKSPFSQDNLAIIKTSKEALCISTSGDYERYIVSKKNHHILDHKTARQNYYYSSVTIMQNGTDCTLLDAVATLVFNTQKEFLKDISKKYKISIIVILEDGEIYFENFKALDIQSIELFPL